MMHTRLCLALTLLHLQSVFFFFFLHLNRGTHAAHIKMHNGGFGRECRRLNETFTCKRPPFPKQKKKEETNRPGASVRSFFRGAQRETELRANPMLTLFILLTP